MLAALGTRRNRHGPTPGSRPASQSVLKLGARALMRQPYGHATRRVGRFEIGPDDAAFRHFAQRPVIQDCPAGTDDDGHGKVCGTHELNMPSMRREGVREVMRMGANFCE